MTSSPPLPFLPVQKTPVGIETKPVRAPVQNRKPHQDICNRKHI